MSSKLVETVVEHVKTPEEELEQLKNSELWLKTQIQEPNNFLNALYSDSSPKKNNISAWAENLERQHELELILKRQTTLDSVGQISSYIKSQLRGLGVHESTLSYVHSVLGYKYKNDNKNRYQNDSDESLRYSESQNSSNLIGDFEQENKQILDTIEQQIQFLKNYRNKAKSSPILSALNSKQRLEYEEINLRIRATILLADQFIDDRQSVPIFAQLKLVMAVVGSTNNFAAGQYVSQIKQFGSNRMDSAQKFFNTAAKPVFEGLPLKQKPLYDVTMKNIKILNKSVQKMKKQKLSTKTTDVMTSKQAMKIVFGVVKKVLAVFDHRTRDEAILDGFYGIQCPECGSYRVKEKELQGIGEWLCFCYNCEWKFEARTVTKCGNCHLPFFEEILDIIKKSCTIVFGKGEVDTGAREGKCPRCQKPLVLPAKMFLKPVLRSK